MSLNEKLNENLMNSTTNIFTFSGEKLPQLGKINLNFIFQNKNFCDTFYIIDLNCKNVIGLETSISLGLVPDLKINALSLNNIFQTYSNVFSGLGELKSVCKLKINPDIVPVVDAPRKIPFSLHEPLQNELKRMSSLNVITRVEEPTEWVNSIVIVKKPNGSLRICLDPRNLNQAILRPHFPFPNIDFLKSKLSGSKFFSSLDANCGFWMVPLDEASSKLCTFNTPFGRYRFLRLPFGINAAPEIFHGEMIKLFGDIEGLIIYIDDFLIFASTVEEHDKILQKVLNRAQEVGLKFNKEKSKICLREIKFIGHVFNEQGIRPDESKIESILKMPKPTSVQELQRFLGMVNYLGSFIENMSSKNKNLRNLLKQDICWQWDQVHEREFENLKNEITKAPVLVYFDPNKPLTSSVDSSKFAVGATIMHGKNPIAYASASLTSTQVNYAQIEKELFAILFGCTKFHQYIFGLKVTVETDHKPLVTLFNKPLFKIPARLQRFMLRLQCYDLNVIYRPGKYLYIADTLSRAPLNEETNIEMDDELSLHCDMLISETTKHINTAKVQEYSKEDETFKILVEYIKNGWPKHKK